MYCYLRLSALIVFIVCIVGSARSEEPLLRTVLRYEQPGKMMELVGISPLPDSEQWLVGIVETTLQGGAAKWGVYNYAPAKGGVLQPLFVELVEKYTRHGLSSLAVNRNGEFYVGGRFSGSVNSIRKISPAGKILIERQFPNETGLLSGPITKLIVTPRDDVFVVSVNEICLLSSDLQLLWRVKRHDIATDCLVITGAVYDSKTEHFVATGMLGELTDFFGPPSNKKRPRNAVVSYDYAGALVSKTELTERDVQVVVSPAGVQVLHSQGPQKEQQDYVIAPLGPKLEIGPEITLQSFPRRALMLSSMFSFGVCPDGRMVAVTSELNTAMRVWPAKGGAPLLSGDTMWLTMGSVSVGMVGANPYVVWTHGWVSTQPGLADPLTETLRIDEIVLDGAKGKGNQQ